MKETVEYPDFVKLDIRVGKVVEAIAPEWSEKLLQFTVYLGEEIGTRTVLSGVKKWYKPEQFEGKLFPFIINLAERKMGESVSQGMMLMVDTDDQPILINLPDSSNPGSMIC